MQSIGNQETSPFKVLAQKYNVTEAQFLLQWAIQHNYAVLPKSIQIDRMQENFDFDFSIDDEDLNYIKTLDKGDSITWEYGDPLAVK